MTTPLSGVPAVPKSFQWQRPSKKFKAGDLKASKGKAIADRARTPWFRRGRGKGSPAPCSSWTHAALPSSPAGPDPAHGARDCQLGAQASWGARAQEPKVCRGRQARLVAHRGEAKQAAAPAWGACVALREGKGCPAGWTARRRTGGRGMTSRERDVTCRPTKPQPRTGRGRPSTAAARHASRCMRRRKRSCPPSTTCRWRSEGGVWACRTQHRHPRAASQELGWAGLAPCHGRRPAGQHQSDPHTGAASRMAV